MKTSTNPYLFYGTSLSQTNQTAAMLLYITYLKQTKQTNPYLRISHKQEGLHQTPGNAFENPKPSRYTLFLQFLSQAVSYSVRDKPGKLCCSVKNKRVLEIVLAEVHVSTGERFFHVQVELEGTPLVLASIVEGQPCYVLSDDVIIPLPHLL